jgi:hypothetical protein
VRPRRPRDPLPRGRRQLRPRPHQHHRHLLRITTRSPP